jgi:hypothetical protein
MIGGFLTLIGLSFVILFCCPRDVVPRDLALIASIALVMAESGDLQHILEGTGRAKLNDIREIVNFSIRISYCGLARSPSRVRD